MMTINFNKNGVDNEIDCPNLESVKVLRINNLKDINDLNLDTFKDLPSLEELDLSGNQLSEIKFLGIPFLQKLNCRNNSLSNVEFLRQFPVLTELYLDGNPLTLADRYIAASLCPKLQKLDGNQINLEFQNKLYENKIKPEIENFTTKLLGKSKEELSSFIQSDESDAVLPKALKQCNEIESGVMNCVDFIVQNTEELTAIHEDNKDFHNSASKQKNNRYQENSVLSKVQPEIHRNQESLSYSRDSLPLKDTIMCALTNNPNSVDKSSDDLAEHCPSKLSSNKNKHHSSNSAEMTNNTNLQTNIVISNYKLRNKSTTCKRKTESLDHQPNISEKSTVTPKKRNTINENTLPSCKQWQPASFIRCHSLDNNPEDDEMQVWRCVFAPDTKRPGERQTSHVVATCGGNTVCIIDCSTCKVLQRYKHHNPKEEFFALAWTTLPLDEDANKVMVILAAAGRLHEIRLFHTDQLICFKDIKCHSRFISSLAFHPIYPTILCSGSADGTVVIWDIGIPSIPDYNMSPRKLYVVVLGSDILNMAVVPNSDIVIAGSENGCFGWNLNSKSKAFQRKPDYEFLHPIRKAKMKSSCIIDSIVMITPDAIASKCAGDGCIYVWDIPSTLKSISKKQTKIKINLIAVLKWSDTDNLYMNMGAQFDHGIVGCGDANGQMWIYNISKLIKQKRKTSESEVYSPSSVIQWPDCIGVDHLSKLKFEYSEIIMNMLAISSDGKYLVAATNKNLLCIWH